MAPVYALLLTLALLVKRRPASVVRKGALRTAITVDLVFKDAVCVVRVTPVRIAQTSLATNFATVMVMARATCERVYVPVMKVGHFLAASSDHALNV